MKNLTYLLLSVLTAVMFMLSPAVFAKGAKKKIPDKYLWMFCENNLKAPICRSKCPGPACPASY